MGSNPQGASIEPEQPSALDRLDSWKEIAEYLGRSVRSARRWETEEGLPVYRHLHQSSGTVYASKAELDAWLLTRTPQTTSAARSREEPAPYLDLQSVGGLRRHVLVAGALVLSGLVAYVGPWRSWSAASANPLSIHSLAVLPLANLTGDPAQAYFADGMTDALITELAQSPGLRVISRTSVVRYKDAKKPLPDIARELNVEAIVEGAVVRSAGRVLITAQLIHAPTDRHLWARSYERDANDLVALEQEVAHAIGGAVVGKLVPQPAAQTTASGPVNAEAYRLFFQGLLAASTQSYEGYKDGIAFCRRAIEKQPDFATAYARMAVYYLQFSFTGPMSPGQFMPQAEAAARKAVALDDALAEGHAVLGAVLYRFHWDWSGSESEFRRALTLDPNYAEGYRMFGQFLLARGRSQDALAKTLRSRELDPLSLQGTLSLAGAYRAVGQYDRAIEEFRNGLEKDPNRPRAHFQLGITYVQLGRLREGINELETALNLTRDNTRFLGYLAYAYARLGRNDEATNILGKLLDLGTHQYVSPTAIARIAVGLNDREAALSWLEKASQERDFDLLTTLSDTEFDELRSEPRYQQILARMGLSSITP
jgi:TolB-like protein/Tfp pilus assembly protein PilF